MQTINPQTPPQLPPEEEYGRPELVIAYAVVSFMGFLMGILAGWAIWG